MERKFFLLPALFLWGALSPINAQVAETGNDGWLNRARLMFKEQNWQGVTDQLQQHRFLSTDDETERDFMNAVAMAHLNQAEAEIQLTNFIAAHKGSAFANSATLTLGRIFLDNENWEAALQTLETVTPDGFNGYESALYSLSKGKALIGTGNNSEAYELLAAITPFNDIYEETDYYRGVAAYNLKEYETAGRIFQTINKNSTYYVPSLLKMAQTAFMTGEWSEAAERATEYLNRSTAAANAADRCEANRIAGEALFNLHRTREAVAYTRTYAECAGPDNITPASSYILGVNDFNEGDYRSAIDRLTPVSNEDNATGQSALLYIGQAFLATDNVSSAALALRKAAAMDYDPEIKETALYNYTVSMIGNASVPFGSTVGALEDFLRQYPSSPYAADIREYIVAAYMADNNYEEALKNIDKITNPSSRTESVKQQILYTLGTRAYAQEQYGKALDYFSKALSIKPGDAQLADECLLWTANCQYHENRFAEAASNYLTYLAKGTATNRPVALYYLGYTRFSQKKYADAITDFERFLRSPGDASPQQKADALNRIADCLYYRKDFSKAAARYEQAYSTYPEAADYPLYQKAMMQGLNGKHSAKIDGMNEMISRYPHSGLVPKAMLEIAESYGDMGDKKAAKNTYSRLADTYPETAQGRQGLLLLAIAEHDDGNDEIAVMNYKKAITSWPSSDEAHVAADDLKRIFAETGRTNEYLDYIETTGLQSSNDRADMERISFEAAEKKFVNDNDTQLLEKYIAQWPDGQYSETALLYLAEGSFANGDVEEANRRFIQLESKASNARTLNEARKGVMKTSMQLERWDVAKIAADRLLASGSLQSAERNEIIMTRAMANLNSGDTEAAITDWRTLSDNMLTTYGAEASYHIAQTLFDQGDTAIATSETQRIIDNNPPYPYWVARAFILMSDINRRNGNTFEADEYLRSLKENYPNSNDDILTLINQRLK